MVQDTGGSFEEEEEEEQDTGDEASSMIAGTLKVCKFKWSLGGRKWSGEWWGLAFPWISKECFKCSQRNPLIFCVASRRGCYAKKSRLARRRNFLGKLKFVELSRKWTCWKHMCSFWETLTFSVLPSKFRRLPRAMRMRPQIAPYTKKYTFFQNCLSVKCLLKKWSLVKLVCKIVWHMCLAGDWSTTFQALSGHGRSDSGLQWLIRDIL